jgi:hypothetical protein
VPFVDILVFFSCFPHAQIRSRYHSFTRGLTSDEHRVIASIILSIEVSCTFFFLISSAYFTLQWLRDESTPSNVHSVAIFTCFDRYWSAANDGTLIPGKTWSKWKGSAGSLDFICLIRKSKTFFSVLLFHCSNRFCQKESWSTWDI